MELAWCQAPDAGLPVPDLLLHLELAAAEAEARGGFGDERYEVRREANLISGPFRYHFWTISQLVPPHTRCGT